MSIREVNVSEYTERAMLAYCHMRLWGGNRQDKSLNIELANNHGADPERTRVSKKLCVCPELTKVKSIQQKIRNIFYHYTSPWMDNGGRVMPAVLYLDAVNAIAPPTAEHEAAVYDFAKVYPDIVELDRRALGSAWKARDYPSPDVIARRFSVDTVFGPMPKEEDFRINLAVEDIEEIKSNLRQGYERAHNQMVLDLLERLTGTEKNPGPIRHMVKKLSDPDAIFRDSLVYNLVELAEFLPRLNYMNDPEINMLIKDIQSRLCSTTPDTLRNDKQVRELVAEEAQEVLDDIESKMSGYF